MVTELLRAWSAGVPFATDGGPRATEGVATLGTAGVMGGLPFTEETTGGLPFAAAAAEPTTTGGVEPVAISGVEVGFLVAPAAEAYDGAAAAGVVVGAGF